MTRSVGTPRVSYDGSGSSGPFSFPHAFTTNSHVKVYLIDSEGDRTLFVEGTNYTLTGTLAASGSYYSSGSLTTTDTVDTGETLVIYRETPQEQSQSVIQGGTFSSTTQMNMADRAVDMIQEQAAKIANFMLPLGGYGPTHATNAGKYFKLNAAGTEVEMAEGVDVSALTPGINCLVIATSNITLSGTQTIDGVGVVAGNIVLVQGQTDQSENGVYVVAAGAWTRHADHDDTTGLQANTSFGITSGTNYSGSIWVQLVLDPVVGTDDIVFGRLGGSIGATDINVGSGGTINFNSGDVVVSHSANALGVTGGQVTITYGAAAGSEPLRLVNSTDNASVEVLSLEGDRATMADNDEAYVSLKMSDDAGAQTEIGRLTWVATDVNAGTSVDGRIDLGVMTAGSLADKLSLDGTALFPSTNDGLAIGKTTNGISDLYMASGAIIDFGNNEVRITSAANALAVTGGSLSVTDGTAASTPAFTATNTADNATVKAATFGGDRATFTDADTAYIALELSDDTGVQTEFGRISWHADDVSDTTEDGHLRFWTATAGSLNAELKLDGTALSPVTNDGLALGTASLAYSDAYFADGATVNFNNAISLTHSAGLLTGTGGQFVWSYGGGAALEPLRLVNTTDSASVQVAQFEGDRATMADNDEAYVSFLMSNDAGAQTEVARQTWVATDVNVGTSVDGRIDWGVMTAGSLADELSLDGTALFPATDDGLAIGKATNGISDLFLASGAVTNYANSDLTITHSTGGLTVDQGGSDGYILSFSSSDIAHGVTAVAPTSVYGAIGKFGTNGGGLQLTGLAENAQATAIKFYGVGDTDTTKTANSFGVFHFEAVENNSGALANMTANSNMLVVANGGQTRFILDADGDSHQDVGTAWTNFDFLDDIGTLNAIAYHVARDDDPIKEKFNEWTLAKRESLEAVGLVIFGEDGRPFMNMSKLAMLNTGAIRQLGEKLAERDEKIAALERRLMAIESK